MVLIKVVKLIIKEKLFTFWYVVYKFNDGTIFSAPMIIWIISFLEFSSHWEYVSNRVIIPVSRFWIACFVILDRFFNNFTTHNKKKNTDSQKENGKCGESDHWVAVS